MKNALLIALALTSISAFAAPKTPKHSKAQRVAAREACKAEGKVKKELKACVKGKLATEGTTAETTAPEAPAAH